MLLKFFAGVLRTIRDAQPAHYLFKIESFSILSEEKIEKYESDDFEVGGYKWYLLFYVLNIAFAV